MGESTPGISDQPAANDSAAPVTGAERIASLDILRGIAILGILVMNIYVFAMPIAATISPLMMGGMESLNIGTWFFTHILFDQKFMSIFAMLFGAGIVLMTGRAEAKGAKYGQIFYRRQFWLVLIGLLHGFFLWEGDILFMYAVIGMLAYLFRNREPRTLIIVACLLLPVSLSMMIGLGESMQKLKTYAEEAQLMSAAAEEITEEQQQAIESWDGQRSMMAPDSESMRDEVASHLGNYAGIFEKRASVYGVLAALTPFLMGWRVLALMLIGMALMKLGVLAAERSASFYRKMILICYGVGLPLTVYSAVNLHVHEFNPIYFFGLGGVPNYFGSIIVGLGHIAVVMLMIKSGFAQNLLQRFASVGRMALTNYLMHSVILTTVFYGYGLGLYGSVPRFQQMGFVVAVVALQLILSPWWLARYRFGPVEWLWRSLTYWKRQRMVR